MCKSCRCRQQGPSVSVFRMSLTGQFTGHLRQALSPKWSPEVTDTSHRPHKAHTVPMFHTLDLGFEHLPCSGQGVRCCGGYNVESLLL